MTNDNIFRLVQFISKIQMNIKMMSKKRYSIKVFCMDKLVQAFTYI